VGEEGKKSRTQASGLVAIWTKFVSGEGGGGGSSFVNYRDPKKRNRKPKKERGVRPRGKTLKLRKKGDDQHDCSKKKKGPGFEGRKKGETTT